MAIFEGAGVAIITPFHTDGSIDYDKFGEVIEQQIANQTDAIIVCGTTGESAKMLPSGMESNGSRKGRMRSIWM